MTGAPLSRILAYEKPLVCIARFANEYASVHGVPREAEHCFYQIIVNPKKVSGSGRFIEFGDKGDQIAGWKPVDSIEVHEILGELTGEGTMKAFLAPDNVETIHGANMADAAFHEGKAA